MKLEFVWPFSVDRQWSISQPTTIDYLPIAVMKPLVRRIQMTCRAVSFCRKSWWRNTETVVWQIDVTLYLKDGNVFDSKQTVTLPLREALRCAHYQTLDAYLAAQQRQIQQKLASMGL